MNIQEKLAESMPELLAFFRDERGLEAPTFTGGSCDRCGATVRPSRHSTHVEWHESLTIGIDALAGLIIMTRDRSS